MFFSKRLPLKNVISTNSTNWQFYERSFRKWVWCLTEPLYELTNGKLTLKSNILFVLQIQIILNLLELFVFLKGLLELAPESWRLVDWRWQLFSWWDDMHYTEANTFFPKCVTHKFHGLSVSHEIAVFLKSGNTIRVHTPFSCCRWLDLKMLNGRSIDSLFSVKRVAAYRGHTHRRCPLLSLTGLPSRKLSVNVYVRDTKPLIYV